MISNKELFENIYTKYNKYKDSDKDMFFYQKIYQKRSPSFMKMVASFVLIVLTSIIISIGGISTYALLGGTIEGKPIIEWIGINFSDEYQNYVEEPKNEQKISVSDTEVNLISTMCDEGYTVIEFNVKLSEKDKEYLRIGERVVSDAQIEKQAKVDLDNLLNKDLKNTLCLIFNSDAEYNGENKRYWQTRNTIIDGEEKWVSFATQTVTKISDYEFKVYQIYFLTDKDLGDKTDFTITLKNIVIANQAEKKKTDSNFILLNMPDNERYIEIGGEFNVELSKKKALENTQRIKGNGKEVTYKKKIQKIDEVIITPMQIIVKLDSEIKDLNINSLCSNENKDYIGIERFKAYDENDNELELLNMETKRTITYENGKTEEWAPGDIGTYKSFYNATMNLQDYVIIERNPEIKSIKLIPIIEELVRNSDGVLEAKDTELDNFMINL